MLVKDWMTTPVATAGPQARVADVVGLMRDRNIHNVPVVDQEGTVLGIISRRFVMPEPGVGASLDAYSRLYQLGKARAREVMRAEVVTVDADLPVEEAARILYDRHVGCLPVTRQGRIAGILSDRDILRALVEISGARRGGCRVSLVLPEAPGGLRQVLARMDAHGFRVVSLMVSGKADRPGMGLVVLRLRGDGDRAALAADLAQAWSEVRVTEAPAEGECRVPR